MAVDLLDPPVALPPRPHRSWLGRLLRRPAILPDPRPEAAAVRELLEDARSVLLRGWVQDAWFVVRDRRGRPRPIGPCHLGRLDRADVAAACLVGAVLQAARLRRAAGHSDAGDAGLAVDLLWHTLREPPGSTPTPAPSPAARAARARDLSRWNDAPERSREDVLALLDAAVLRSYPSAEIIRECATPR